MSEQWTGPTPEEILAGLYQTGRSQAELTFIFNLIDHGVRNETIRNKIGCLDNIKGFFSMAQRMYVNNDNSKHLEDAELGIHVASCKSPLCNKLTTAYYQILRPSTDEQSNEIADKLATLADEIMLGKHRPDLENQSSGYYDSVTEISLLETHVVEITDKCIVDEEFERKIRKVTEANREVLLAYIPTSQGILCSIKDRHGLSGSFKTFNIHQELLGDLNSAFDLTARRVGIDADLLQAIIMANSPEHKSLPE